LKRRPRIGQRCAECCSTAVVTGLIREKRIDGKNASPARWAAWIPLLFNPWIEAAEMELVKAAQRYHFIANLQSVQAYCTQVTTGLA
jgi:hypothetical protein